MRPFTAILMMVRFSLRSAAEAHVLRRFALLLTLATVGACGSDSGTSPTSDAIEGTYTLRTVNGSALPFTILQSGTYSVTLTSDVITLAGNGSWTESMSYRETINGQTTNETDADAGTWVRAGSSVTLRSNVSGGTAYAGTFSNGSLTLNADGFVAVFSR